MKKINLVFFVIITLSLISASVTHAAEPLTLNIVPSTHFISVGNLKEEHWVGTDAENVTMVELGPSENYENQTLEGAIAYLAHDKTFLYVLVDSIYVQQQIRLDYAQIAFDAENDNITTHLTDQYYFTVFGANHVYFSQQVAYNKTIDPETEEEEGFTISVCHNMPPSGLIPPLQLWGFYQSSWNEPNPHGMFSFKIPLSNLGVETFPFTMGVYINAYKSVNDSEEAEPDEGPYCAWPSEANFSDQSTWGKITLKPVQYVATIETVISNTTVTITTYTEGTESYIPPEKSPGFETTIFLTSLALFSVFFIIKRRRLQ